MAMMLHARQPEECLMNLPNGEQYVEFSCLYPILENFYFKFEKQYYNEIGFYFQEYVTSSAILPKIIAPCVVILYVVGIKFGKESMANRKPWQWRNILAAWNFFLCLFSFMGMIRTILPVFHYMNTLSIRENMCNSPYQTWMTGTTGLWFQLFILSKFPELIDTFFIIIHKKPLLFLHWYHHTTVLLYVWCFAFQTVNPMAPFFAAMNFSVHAFMYGYYFLMAMRMKPKWLNPIFITGAQILQMIAGICLSVAGVVFYVQNRYAVYNGHADTCELKGNVITAAILMYTSYLVLFVKFFTERFSNVDINLSMKKRK
mmetsp:Transcript_15592/g.18983  ORF Transcript_15592/g.18983 Transcript_15592/m.18983 type:complete len:315 (+) Transcript_15592:184-1128(+)